VAPSDGGEPQLVRGLGLLEATSLVIGGIIGVSIFLVPGMVAREVGAPGLALAVWAATGVLATCGALCFAELAAAIPETGGTYAFLRRTYRSPLLSFLFGWTMFFATSTAAIAAVATSIAVYGGYFISRVMPYGSWASRAVAVAMILGVTLVNYLGVRVGGKTQNVLTLLKIIVVVGVIVVCLALGKGDTTHFTPLLPAGRDAAGAAGSFGTAMILTLFAYSGWHFSTHVAGEVRDPRRNVPRSIFVGMGVVVTVYLLVNVAMMYVLPFDRLRASTLVGSDAVEAVLGPRGAGVVALVITVSAIGGLNAQLLNYPRIVFALARDGLFFRAASRVHPERGTPATAILIQGLWACGFALSGTYQQILSYVGFVNHLFLSLAVAGVIVLRVREPQLARPYRVWGYPLTPALFLLVSAWYLGSVLLNRFAATMVGVGLMLAGLPFYAYWSRVRGGGRAR